MAIVGSGVISRTHLAALRADGRAEVRLLCDLDPAAASGLDPDLPWTADVAAVLADPAIDLVHVLTPHHAHAAQVVAALAAGKHVVVEKPLATTPDDVAAMCAAAAAAEERGQIAACIFQHRLAPGIRALRRHLRDRAFGSLEEVVVHVRCTRTSAYYNRAAWRGTWAGEGGGLLINQAIHALDLACYCFGQPLAVDVRVANQRLGRVIEVEDQAHGTLTFGGGLRVHLDAANDQTTGWEPHLIVRGSRGGCRYSTNGDGTFLELAHDDPAVRDDLLAAVADPACVLPGKREYGGLHAVQIADAIHAVLARRRPAVTIADGAVTTRTVLACYHATAISQAVDPAFPPGAAYTRPCLVPELLRA